jgi:ribonucleotide reductase beta subunit family protein with ferritin-like domain
MTEPLLDPENNRLTIFPIKFDNIWEMYQKMEASFWTSKEIDWSKDKYDFKKLNENEQRFIKYVLAFFSASDTIVNMNLGERLSQEVQPLEAKMVYQFQMMIENIHSQTYSLQIENIIEDYDEKLAILNAVENVPCIKKKTDWMMKWIKSTDSFPIRLVAQTISEGLFFSGSFCSIFWLKQKNIMPGLISSNELIARDEGMHCDFSIMLYHMLNRKLSQDTIHQMFEDAVETERVFICESLPCSLLGMNADLMEQYIKYVADRLITQLGYEKLYKVENPFTWMEAISIEGKTNFFEHRPTQYQRAEVLNETKQQTFEVSEDF